MLRKIKRLVLCVFLFFPLLYFIVHLRLPGKNANFAKNLDKAIQTSAPIGSNRALVEKWLTSTQIIKYGYVEGQDNLKYETVALQSKFPIEQLRGIIKARLPDVGRSLLMEWEVEIIFFFDKEGKLIDYSIQEGGYGL